jgi:membrane-bound lytic murein transglycosylase D
MLTEIGAGPEPVEVSQDELQETMEAQGVGELEAGDSTESDEIIVEFESENKDTKFNPFKGSENLTNGGRDKEAVKNDKLDFKLDFLSEHYDFWLDYYTRRDKSRFQRQLTQGEAYRDIVEKILEEEGLPKELFYVGLIESGYSMHVRSHASAVGPWQFIKGTATRYGMSVNNQVDERRNIHKATRAAAHYYKDLYNIFGSWELALCAYNAGEYRVINAIRKGGTRSYRELVRKRLLPRETIYYVPKLAVAKHLSENREKYDLKVNKIKDDFYINADEVHVKGSFSLKDLSKKLGLNLKDLKKLNPDFLYRVVRAPRAGQRVIVPFDKIEVAKSLEIVNRAVAQKQEEVHYRVRRGDNLISIARRFGTSVSKIKRLNRLRSSKILLGQKLKIDGVSTQRYSVQRGDNLGRIARLHRTTVSDLRRMNNLRGSRILVGQNLKVPNAAIKVYTVRRGDNLAGIAHKFNTSISSIMKINSLNNTRIYPNQKIHIPGEG